MKYLVCNAGSTSLKFKLFEMPEGAVLAKGRVERVRSLDSAIFHYDDVPEGRTERLDGQCIPDYTAGIDLFFSYLMGKGGRKVIESLDEIECVSFKTVLARNFYGVHELTDEVMDAMRAMLPVAPAHNGPYIEVIEAMKAQIPGARLVGAFETAFHKDIPLARRIYAAPYEWYSEYGLMRMGYHGASHRYVSETVDALSGGSVRRLVSCHLGGSSSLCAVLDGKSVDTSFGFSLQTGIPHAERCGDFDTFAIPYLEACGIGRDDIFAQLSKNGGLKGISGVSGDLRFVEEAAADGNERAALAIDMFCESIVKTAGAFAAVMGGLDAIAFAGGIGENSSLVREKVCRAFAFMGLELDSERNGDNARVISAEGSRVKAYVIPTDEESVVVKQAYEYLHGN